MGPEPTADQTEELAVRRCFSPACPACLPPAALHLIVYRRDGGSADCRSLPLPPRADPGTCARALAELEHARPGARLHYELCAEGVGVIRADRAGWLARLPERGNFPPAGRD